MATEWYYRENEAVKGPISGRELKDLAGIGSIFPSTPVYRVYNGEKSPWTRAGAIKELFPGDVVNQLGDPICDSCGIVKVDGICLGCNPPTPPPPPSPHGAEVNANSPASDIVSPVPRLAKRYKALRFYVAMIRAAAWCVLLLTALSIIVAVVQTLNDPRFRHEESRTTVITTLVTIQTVATLVGGITIFVLLMAIADSIEVFMDIEENTRETAMNTRNR